MCLVMSATPGESRRQNMASLGVESAQRNVLVSPQGCLFIDECVCEKGIIQPDFTPDYYKISFGR